MDCDDFEALWRADRIRARWAAGLKSPELAGGVDYQTISDGYHWAGWQVSHDDGKLIMRVFQPQAHRWEDPRAVIKRGVYFDT